MVRGSTNVRPLSLLAIIGGHVLAGALPASAFPTADPAIAFAETGIKVMDADGSNVRTVVAIGKRDVARSPAWSPTGSHLAFAAKLGGVVGVYAVPLAGGTPRRVVATLETGTGLLPWPDWSPVPSPDGLERIAYVDTGLASGDRDIFLVCPDGSGRINLTQTPGTYEHIAAWAPDGRRLLVQRETVQLAVLEIGLVGAQLGVVGETVVYFGNSVLASPQWSNTSEQVAFAIFPATLQPSRIVTLDLANPAAVPLFLSPTSTGGQIRPSFSPDDSRLVFQRGTGIFTIGADGSGEVRIRASGVDPSWRRNP